MVLDHRLRNTGKRVIQTSVYNHNFLYLDRQAPGPDFSLTVPFKIRTSQPLASSLADIRENRITFSKPGKPHRRPQRGRRGHSTLCFSHMRIVPHPR